MSDKCEALHPELGLRCNQSGTHRNHTAWRDRPGGEIVAWLNEGYKAPPPKPTKGSAAKLRLREMAANVASEPKVGPPSGEALKSQGIAQANQNATAEWAYAFDRAAITLAHQGVVFTSEDVCAIAGRPDHPNRVGARMNSLARLGIIERVGFDPAERPNQHAALISQWKGAGATTPEPDSQVALEPRETQSQRSDVVTTAKGDFGVTGTAVKAKRKLKVLDLFSGLHGWAQPFIDRGHEVVTLDFDPKFNCTITADILETTAQMLRDAISGGYYDIILASPPCEKFSVMNLSKHWEAFAECKVCHEPAYFKARGRTFFHTAEQDEQWQKDALPHHEPQASLGFHPGIRPKSKDAEVAQAIVEKTIALITELKPKAWIMENPRAMMRRLPVLEQFERHTVTYCHYGKHYMKPTDLWGGFPPTLTLEEPCKNGDPCHEAAPRGAKTGTQGIATPEERALIPYDLAMAVCEAMEQWMDAPGAKLAINPGPLKVVKRCRTCGVDPCVCDTSTVSGQTPTVSRPSARDEAAPVPAPTPSKPKMPRTRLAHAP